MASPLVSNRLVSTRFSWPVGAVAGDDGDAIATAQASESLTVAIDQPQGSHPHFEAYVAMYDTDGDPVVADSGTITISVSNGNFVENPTVNTINLAAPTSINWSGHTESVVFDGFDGVAEGDVETIICVVWAHAS